MTTRSELSACSAQAHLTAAAAAGARTSDLTEVKFLFPQLCLHEGGTMRKYSSKLGTCTVHVSRVTGGTHGDSVFWCTLTCTDTSVGGEARFPPPAVAPEARRLLQLADMPGAAA